MQENEPNPDQIFQLSQAVLAQYDSLHMKEDLAHQLSVIRFAELNRISALCAQFYLLLGAANFHKLDDFRIMFAAVTPAQAGQILKLRPKNIASWLSKLMDRGLLTREAYGAYRIADINQWCNLTTSIVDAP